MRRLPLLALVAALGLSACGAGQDEGSGSPTTETEAAALPDVARVVCEPSGTRVETPVVKPQPDGIHLEIVNETGSERSFSLTSADGGTGTGAPAGTSTQVVDLGPGALTVACTDPTLEAEGGEPLEVTDEDGIWVSTRLGCAEQFSSVIDYAQDAKGETGDPLEAARKALESYGLEPDDVFERAGYPEAEGTSVRMVRAGESLAVIFLVDDGDGKWLVGGVNGCSSLES